MKCSGVIGVMWYTSNQACFEEGSGYSYDETAGVMNQLKCLLMLAVLLLTPHHHLARHGVLGMKTIIASLQTHYATPLPSGV